MASLSVATQLHAQSAFRTKNSGSWNDILTWERWNGSAWVNPVSSTEYPGPDDSVYIQMIHTVTLTQSQSCHHLNLANGPGTKLNLNGFNLLVSGRISLFTGTASFPVLYTNINLGASVSNGADNSGFIRIVGNTRTLFKANEWATNFMGLNLQIVLIDNTQLVAAETDITVGRLVLLSGDLSVDGNLYLDNGTTGGDLLVGTATVLSVSKSLMRNALAGAADSLLVEGTLKLSADTTGESLLAATLIVFPEGMLEMSNTEAMVFTVPNYIMHTASRLLYSGNIPAQPVGNEFPRNGIRTLVLNTTGSIALGEGKNISDTLIMVSGNIHVPTGDSLTLGVNAGAVLLHSSGSIIGKINRYVPLLTANVMLFPTGTDNYHRPLQVDFSGASIMSGNISVTHTDGTGGTSITPFTDGSLVIDRRSNMYWDVSPNSGLLASNIELRAGIDGQEGISDSTQLRLIGSRDNGTSLSLLGGVSIPIIGNLLGMADLDLDSGLRLYLGGNININPLPVKLVTFRAEQSGETVNLIWQTAEEVNSRHFEIERSHDGRAFHSISIVEAAGNSSRNSSYLFTDRDPHPGINFYRLAQVDLNGQTAYSGIVSVIRAASGHAQVSVWPNPVREKLCISFGNGSCTGIEVYDINGRTKAVSYTSSQENGVTVDLSGLEKGIYIVRLMISGEQLENIRIQKL